MTKTVISKYNLKPLLARLRKSKKTIVFTNGVFDIIHRGHVTYLTKAKSHGDILIVGLNTDASVRRLKGKNRPINNQRDRAVVLGALKPVDFVVLFGEDTPEKLIKQIKPDILVKGADYKLSEIVGASFVKSYGGNVKRVPLVSGRSTTKTIKRMDGTDK